jgi:type III restriction enzyme
MAKLGWPGVTATTRRLFEHWTAEGREKRFFFCQIEGLETAIFLTEAASKQSGGSFFENEIRRFNENANPGLYRVAASTRSAQLVRLALSLRSTNVRNFTARSILATSAIASSP